MGTLALKHRRGYTHNRDVNYRQVERWRRSGLTCNKRTREPEVSIVLSATSLHSANSRRFLCSIFIPAQIFPCSMAPVLLDVRASSSCASSSQTRPAGFRSQSGVYRPGRIRCSGKRDFAKAEHISTGTLSMSSQRAVSRTLPSRRHGEFRALDAGTSTLLIFSLSSVWFHCS